MSVWNDIRNKSLGKEKRTEDTELHWPKLQRVYAKTIPANMVSVQPLDHVNLILPPLGKTMWPTRDALTELMKQIKDISKKNKNLQTEIKKLNNEIQNRH